MAYGRKDRDGRKSMREFYNAQTGFVGDIKEYLGGRGISIISANTECALAYMIKRGEKVWDECRGCKDTECMYNHGLEKRIIEV